MDSRLIRKKYLDFFKNKEHLIVPSAPLVIKNDPTLMFSNSGMTQFKDYFLGVTTPKSKRIADTQKCLRVSGKHNDLEEVGIDTYHHTMFEMLGNWSFGDYFKKEAISWAWELLTEVYNIPKDRLYVTVFEGDKSENLERDTEAFDLWSKLISTDRIIDGNKKDNFWEMGEVGPCGPCSEIHVDIRSDEERLKVDGKSLVNSDHPQVVEIWNLVFMEFNRKANGSLEKLPDQHIDTGMGFERLCMALQGKNSNYDTDVFQPTIQFLAKKSNIKYSESEQTDIAMRVIADHIRAISFTISDGQLPSNNGAGYVIRRILRRAVRYGYTFLGFKEPFMYSLVQLLADQFADIFPELKQQQEFVEKVIKEEEISFFRTLSTGIERFETYFKTIENNIFSGKNAFELYDTYGFPIDLTQLLAKEKNAVVDMDSFNACLEEQKNRSRAATVVNTGDWVMISEDVESEFIGYDILETETKIVKYRLVKSKGKESFQVVLNKTPFYPEGGGQVGSCGTLSNHAETINVIDTKKENGLIVHFIDQLPEDLSKVFIAKVNIDKCKSTANNHTATHLLQCALRNILGTHVEQKGSLVDANILRFDFSHFAKVTDEEIAKIELFVNNKIQENICLNEKRNIPYQEALDSGVIALFGEKYGEKVRVIEFGESKELCGGLHAPATGCLGTFKIISESSVAAGVRRIEAVTANNAIQVYKNQEDQINSIKELLKNPKDLVKALGNLLDENARLNNQTQDLLNEKASLIKNNLVTKVNSINGINTIIEMIDLPSNDVIKNLSFEMRSKIDNLFLVLGYVIDGKPNISLIISDSLVESKKLDASKIIRDLAKEIQGGGGGQAFYATAGGKNIEGLSLSLDKAKNYINSL